MSTTIRQSSANLISVHRSSFARRRNLTGRNFIWRGPHLPSMSGQDGARGPGPSWYSTSSNLADSKIYRRRSGFEAETREPSPKWPIPKSRIHLIIPRWWFRSPTPHPTALGKAHCRTGKRLSSKCPSNRFRQHHAAIRPRGGARWISSTVPARSTCAVHCVSV
jgi:hypothetical protein